MPASRLPSSLALTLGALVLLAPGSAFAAPPEQPPAPFGKGTIVPRLGLGVNLGDDVSSVNWALGAGYFVVDGLEVGARVSGLHLIWDAGLKSELPGIEDELPGTLIDVTPLLRFVFFRSPYFSPYAFGGVGPTFVTNNAPAPVIGHWTAGPGVAIGFGAHVFLDISVSFSGRMTVATCEEAFTDTFESAEGPVEFELGGLCRWRWSPGIGLGVAF